MPLSQRLREFPWMLSDLIFPFMAEYLVSRMETCHEGITNNSPAYMVLDLGDDPQRPRGSDPVRRPQFLRPVVEQRYVFIFRLARVGQRILTLIQYLGTNMHETGTSK